MTKNILITGGSGFIGKALINKLSSYDYNIITVSRTGISLKNNFNIDLFEPEEVNNFILSQKKIDTIIHCAAALNKSSTPRKIKTSEYNSKIVNNLVSAFCGVQPHWIFLSSISIYGDDYENEYISIVNSPLSSDHYGEGKVKDEKKLLVECKNLDILRLMPVHSISNSINLKKRVFIPGTSLRFKISPSPLYSLCDVDTATDKILDCILHFGGLRIHQIGDEPISQNNLADKFNGPLIPIPKIIFDFLLKIIPKKITFFKTLRLSLYKISQTNIYERGIKQIENE